MSSHLTFEACDAYMGSRTGKYEYRAIRYRRAIDKMVEMGLNDDHTIYDVGAGWTELDYCLRVDYDWKGRYAPLDAGMSSLDLNTWCPERETDFFVALEILEHLYDPGRLLRLMAFYARRGVVCSVPNPRTVDVYAMDDTHFTAPDKSFFREREFNVEEFLAYGGVFSEGKNDALFAWRDNTTEQQQPVLLQR